MKRNFTRFEFFVPVLCAACLALGVALCLAKPVYLIPVAAIILAAAAAAAVCAAHTRRLVRHILYGEKSAEGGSFAALGMPVLILSGDVIIWYNEAFRKEILGGDEACLEAIRKRVPAFDRALTSEPTGQNLENGGRRYTVYGSAAEGESDLYIAYFVDNTALKRQAGEYIATRPSVMLIAVDTYDEILKELKESERARIAGEIDLALEQFIGATSGFLRRTGTSRYLAVVEERHMQEIVKNRFSILDTVRAIGQEDITVTLSIGVGRLGDTFRECEEMAVQALDMALGRGGDQAAVKSKNGFEFYGGVSRSVEKRSKVKSRIIATALHDLIVQSDDVIIMGHKMSDLDSVGSAVGVWRICQMCHKPACIVVDEKRTLSEKLLAQFKDADHEGCLRTPDEMENQVSPRTLVIIVDTHMARMVENETIYKRAKNVVVIDHHRKCVGHIDNAVIFYHETSASSASELVTELIQYMPSDKETRLTAVEAQALLAGITLDTRNFALHTGVRTFEAAAYLRRMGAQTQAVKKLFNSSLESYAYRAQLVTDAELYMGCAVVVADELPEHMDVVIPQAANDLLTIDGVEASFVAVNTGSQISISARSMGDLNVQVVMETLGGGGHLTMAGAQLRGVTVDEARKRLFDAITQYRETQHATRGAKENR